jgi:hypothetical protein
VPAVVAVLLAVLVPQMAVGAYSSPENKLGYSACLWPAGKVVRVRMSADYPFPNAGFSDRLNEAVGRWNEVLSTSTRAGGVIRVEGPEADVTFEYRAPEGNDKNVLAETYLLREGDADPSSDIGKCPARRPQESTMKAAWIRINPRSDWFTQPDSMVGMWQMCPDESFRAMNQALCAAVADFASVAVHEMGHTMVYYHPQTLDDIDQTSYNEPGSASTAAKCVEATGGFDAQATMCMSQGMWRAEQRTLETWDVDTAHRAYS